MNNKVKYLTKTMCDNQENLILSENLKYFL